MGNSGVSSRESTSSDDTSKSDAASRLIRPTSSSERALEPADALTAATEALGYDSAVLDSAPAWIRSELLFPYDQGLTFVDQLIADGGLAACQRRIGPRRSETVYS